MGSIMNEFVLKIPRDNWDLLLEEEIEKNNQLELMAKESKEINNQERKMTNNFSKPAKR